MRTPSRAPTRELNLASDSDLVPYPRLSERVTLRPGFTFFLRMPPVSRCTRFFHPEFLKGDLPQGASGKVEPVKLILPGGLIEQLALEFIEPRPNLRELTPGEWEALLDRYIAFLFSELDYQRALKAVQDYWFLWRLIVYELATIDEIFGPFPEGLPLNLAFQANIALNEKSRRESELLKAARESGEGERRVRVLRPGPHKRLPPGAKPIPPEELEALLNSGGRLNPDLDLDLNLNLNRGS